MERQRGTGSLKPLLLLHAQKLLPVQAAAYTTATFICCFCWPLLLLGLNRALTTSAGALRVAGSFVLQGTDLAKFMPCLQRCVECCRNANTRW